jgi:hypothetical protein
MQIYVTNIKKKRKCALFSEEKKRFLSLFFPQIGYLCTDFSKIATRSYHKRDFSYVEHQ